MTGCSGAVHRADVRDTHTRVGRCELASGGGVDFSDETCFCVVREIVTFASGIDS
jgi:hypothetical protein